jgi:UDP-N-acetylglucosamine--N-acetylmuramyl-(pentapeptide) pyrophosphoryl-undecaprenol N-acetylglucosamine transferase
LPSPKANFIITDISKLLTVNIMPTILFTGGGSAGHVTPNLALIKKFQTENWQTIYAGSPDGIEKNIISEINIPYYAITSGKLRRHFSWQNFLSPFKVIQGIIQAFLVCKKLKPQVVFSKGGFVAFPVVVGAWLNNIPVIAHESDLSPGLANRLSFPFTQKICVTFPEGANFFKNKNKVLVTGTPIRKELLHGNAEQGRKFCGFTTDKKIILIYGGGLGSAVINQAIRSLLPQLLTQFQIIHLCGKNKIDNTFANMTGYQQFEYINAELPDLFACAALVISRAGANSIYELLTLRKPHLLIPLSTKASRGDQIQNANYFANLGLSEVIYEEELTSEKLFEKTSWLKNHQFEITEKLRDFKLPNSIEILFTTLTQLAKK